MLLTYARLSLPIFLSLPPRTQYAALFFIVCVRKDSSFHVARTMLYVLHVHVCVRLKVGKKHASSALHICSLPRSRRHEDGSSVGFFATRRQLKTPQQCVVERHAPRAHTNINSIIPPGFINAAVMYTHTCTVQLTTS